MRNYFNLYRLATLLIILFDLGHTWGGVVFHKSSGAAEDAVLATMQSTHFDFKGTDCTYLGFHTGYGLLTTILLTLSAFLTWQLGKRDASPALRPVAWALFISFMGISVISWKYFFAGPGVISTLVALLLGYRCISESARQWRGKGN